MKKQIRLSILAALMACSFAHASSSTIITVTPVVQDGSTQTNAYLPDIPASAPGAPIVWSFSPVVVVAGTTVWFDPDVATGYTYEVSGGPLIKAVMLPTGIGDNQFDISTWSGSAWQLYAPNVLGGATTTFTTPVERFMVTGIEVSANIDPKNGNAFAAGLTFDAPGTVNLVQTPITAAVPEPETYAMLGAGLLLLAGVCRRRKNADSLAG